MPLDESVDLEIGWVQGGSFLFSFLTCAFWCPLDTNLGTCTAIAALLGVFIILFCLSIY